VRRGKRRVKGRNTKRRDVKKSSKTITTWRRLIRPHKVLVCLFPSMVRFYTNLLRAHQAHSLASLSSLLFGNHRNSKRPQSPRQGDYASILQTGRSRENGRHGPSCRGSYLPKLRNLGTIRRREVGRFRTARTKDQNEPFKVARSMYAER